MGRCGRKDFARRGERHTQQLALRNRRDVEVVQTYVRGWKVRIVFEEDVIAAVVCGRAPERAARVRERSSSRAVGEKVERVAQLTRALPTSEQPPPRDQACALKHK